MRRVLLGVVAALMLSGCVATGTYTPPPASARQDFQRTYSASFDRVWTALVDHASSSFFGIDNFEKSSGLMTLSFGAQGISTFVDCGRMKATAPTGETLDMPYAEYVENRFGARLSGKMNLVVRAISPDSSAVRVNARYVLTVPNPPPISPETFAFETTTQATVPVRNAMVGTIPTRTCQPTLSAEKTILDGVAESLRKH